MEGEKTVPEQLRIYQTVKHITALGPFSRYGLWVQGCTRACPGCISPEAQPPEGGYLRSVEDLAQEILGVEGIEGITISGGEPYLQKEALTRLLRLVRRSRDLGVILYTGFSFPEIAGEELTELCDAVIDGPYIQEKNDGRSLRGSSNQRLVLLTDRYRQTLEIGALGRKYELCRTEEGSMVLVGVPSPERAGFAEELRAFLSEVTDL